MPGGPTAVATHEIGVTAVDPAAFLASARASAPPRPQAPPVRARSVTVTAADLDADDPMPWRLLSACRDTNPTIFYPQLAPTERWDRSDPDVSAAMSLCRVCRVQADCLTYALEHREDEGIWGGTDPFTRRAMLRSMGGRISSGNVPVEPAEIAEVIPMPVDDVEPTDEDLAELEAALDLDDDVVDFSGDDIEALDDAQEDVDELELMAS